MSLSSGTVWRIGATFGFSAVSLGAFGAHALRSRRPDLSPKAVKNWETASSYLLLHGVALLALAAHPRLVRSRAPALIIAGTVLFSGSIYGLVLVRPEDATGRKFLGPLTPIGGTSLSLNFPSEPTLSFSKIHSG